MQLWESIESEPVDGDPNANTTKPFSSGKTAGIVKLMVTVGFTPKTPLWRFTQLFKKDQFMFVVCCETTGALRWLLFSLWMQLDGEYGLEHMAESYRHNMEGNVCQWFVDSLSSPGKKYCTLSRKTVAEMTPLGRLWHSSPSITAGITVYSKSADSSLRLQLFCATCTPSPSMNALPLPFWCGNRFPFNLCYLFCLVQLPCGAKRTEKPAALMIQNLKSLAGPVSHGGAYSPSDVSWPFPWGSQAARAASVNTGPSVPFQSLRRSLDR